MTNTKLLRAAALTAFAVSLGVATVAPASAQIQKANPQTMSQGSNGQEPGGGGTQNGNLGSGQN